MPLKPRQDRSFYAQAPLMLAVQIHVRPGAHIPRLPARGIPNGL